MTSLTDTRRVLLVDDDRDIVVGTRMRLRVRGYETIEAFDGQEALEAAAEHQPDVILMDIRMPRMDGLTALAHLGRNPETQHIPVIVLSASMVDQKAALEGGARFFLSKPYQSGQLMSALDAVFQN